nr:aminotransferase class I/II-fold pyridoxal phosphate-dependent enzyme [Pseudoxanthomonas broegbernensis]
MEEAGRSVIHMEFGQPSTPAPAAALAAVRDALQRDPPGYWESVPLRERIARHYRERYAVDVDPRRILLTCGASPALLLALLSWFRAGDRIAFARPGYIAYRNTTLAAHLRPVEIGCGPASRYQLTAAAIRALDPAPAGVILASPANPTGTIIPADELRAIAQACRERGIAIVSDEIYHGLHYTQPAHSVLEFAPDALVVNSFSKYYSMVDWRLGWLLVPDAHVDTARAYAGNLFLTPPSPSQQAARVAMDRVDELEGHRAVYARNRDLLLDALPALGLERIAPPDGAFYVWADVGHLTGDSLAFCTRLLEETGVALAPGVDFDPVDGHRFIRFSFAPATAHIEEALRRLRPWFAAQPRAG